MTGGVPRDPPQAAGDDGLYFEIDEDTTVHLRCPDCYEVLWLVPPEVKTLADVVKAARAHVCYPEGGAS